MAAALYDILTAILSDVQALDLPGLAPANIVLQKVVSTKVVDTALPDDASRYPCVLIAPWGRETVDAASNLRDDVTYPVAVVILASEKVESAQPGDKQRQNFNQYLLWRETIRKSFSWQRLTATLCHTVRVEPLEIVDRAAWEQRGIWASGLVLRCVHRESRG